MPEKTPRTPTPERTIYQLQGYFTEEDQQLLTTLGNSISLSLIIAERIVNGESLELGFLGINGATPTDGTLGALVSTVVDDSPADLAGLQIGDLIIEVDGELVTTMEQLSADFKFFRPGDEIEIDVLREGERITLEVTVGSN